MRRANKDTASCSSIRARCMPNECVTPAPGGSEAGVLRGCAGARGAARGLQRRALRTGRADGRSRPERGGLLATARAALPRPGGVTDIGPGVLADAPRGSLARLRDGRRAVLA